MYRKIFIAFLVSVVVGTGGWMVLRYQTLWPFGAPALQKSRDTKFLPRNIIAEKSRIPLYYEYVIHDKVRGPFVDNNNHPLLDGAYIIARWSIYNPSRGKFDWTSLDKKISDWTANGKKIFISVGPYGQTPRSESPTGDNSDTPQWVYDSGVPRITFSGGGRAEGAIVSIPKVWDPDFYPLYEEFIKALINRYNKDPRVGGYLIGIGHLGTLVAQPSRDGGEKLLESGWTLPIWINYIQKVVNLYTTHSQKPLWLRTSPLFTRSFLFEDYPNEAKQIIQYAAERGVSMVFLGLDPSRDKFNQSLVPQLVQHLASLSLPKEYTIGFSDDWALWVPDPACPGPVCGRDINGLKRELQEAIDTWNDISRKHPIFFIFNRSETDATNPNKPGFNQKVYDVVKGFLYIGVGL